MREISMLLNFVEKMVLICPVFYELSKFEEAYGGLSLFRQ